MVSELQKTAKTFSDLADAFAEMLVSGEETKTEMEPKEKEAEMTLPEIRAILPAKSRAGHTAEVKELLLKHGADRLSEIDPKEYPILAKEAEVLDAN